jgi:hypothetical protein
MKRSAHHEEPDCQFGARVIGFSLYTHVRFLDEPTQSGNRQDVNSVFLGLRPIALFGIGRNQIGRSQRSGRRMIKGASIKEVFMTKTARGLERSERVEQ